VNSSSRLWHGAKAHESSAGAKKRKVCKKILHGKECRYTPIGGKEKWPKANGATNRCKVKKKNYFMTPPLFPPHRG
jgi:hypothetical protein